MIHKTMAEAEADREELKINLCYTEMNAEDQEKTLGTWALGGLLHTRLGHDCSLFAFRELPVLSVRLQ